MATPAWTQPGSPRAVHASLLDLRVQRQRIDRQPAHARDSCAITQAHQPVGRRAPWQRASFPEPAGNRGELRHRPGLAAALPSRTSKVAAMASRTTAGKSAARQPTQRRVVAAALLAQKSQRIFVRGRRTCPPASARRGPTDQGPAPCSTTQRPLPERRGRTTGPCADQNQEVSRCAAQIAAPGRPAR